MSLIFLVLPILAGGQSDFALKASLAVGIGYGIISCVFFIWLPLSGNAHYSAYFAMECALVALSAAVLAARGRKMDAQLVWRPSAAPSLTSRTRRLILVALLFLLFSRMAGHLIEAVGEPHGTTDAWMIWNLRARFLFRAGPCWNDLSRFTQYTAPYHPDYPMMLPLSVSRGWRAAGVESLAVPILIGLFSPSARSFCSSQPCRSCATRFAVFWQPPC